MSCPNITAFRIKKRSCKSFQNSGILFLDFFLQYNFVKKQKNFEKTMDFLSDM